MTDLEKVPTGDLQREIERRWRIDADNAAKRRREANTAWTAKQRAAVAELRRYWHLSPGGDAPLNDGGPGAP